MNKLSLISSLALAFSVNAYSLEMPEERYGALAFSRSALSNGVNPIGKSVSESSSSMARRTAIQSCNQHDCEIKMEVRRGCIGVAIGFENPGPRHLTAYPNMQWYGFGAVRFRADDATTQEQVEEYKEATRNQAGALAVVGCKNASHGIDCQVIETFCTWDYGRSNLIDLRSWINSLGGEGAVGIFNTKQQLSNASLALNLKYGLTTDQAHCVAGRYFATLESLASSCKISVSQLDQVYGRVNR